MPTLCLSPLPPPTPPALLCLFLVSLFAAISLCNWLISYANCCKCNKMQMAALHWEKQRLNKLQKRNLRAYISIYFYYTPCLAAFACVCVCSCVFICSFIFAYILAFYSTPDSLFLSLYVVYPCISLSCLHSKAAVAAAGQRQIQIKQPKQP